MKQHGVYYVTGGLRSGKSLICTRKIQEFLQEGRRVVTNFDLKLENMLSHSKRNIDCLRIPDHPTVDDLEAIGDGYFHNDPEHYDESKFGLIVLDELGTWMNSRNWQDKTRKAVIDWLLHSGKKRWVLMLIIQDLELLDSQAAAATANQYVVRCKRLGSYSVPMISPVFKLFFDKPLKLPDGHLATVRVGSDRRSPVADRWLYRGNDLYRAYNTRQIFSTRDSPSASMLYSYLSPWHLAGRYEPTKDWSYYRDKLNQNASIIALSLLPVGLISILCLPLSAYALIRNVELSETINKLQTTVATLPAAPGITPTIAPTPPSIEKADCSHLKQFDDAYITGYTILPTGASHTISNGKKSFNSKRFVEMGYSLTAQNKCFLTIEKAACKLDLNCDVKRGSEHLESVQTYTPPELPQIPG